MSIDKIRPNVLCADRFYMAETAMDLITEHGTVIWTDNQSDNELAFVQFIRDTQPIVIISEYIPITGSVMDAAPTLKGIVGWGVGYDHIDVEAAAQRGIYVANTRESNAESVAEHVFAFILCFARKILPTDAFVRGGNWTTREEAGLPINLVALDLYAKTLGIIGLGAIGSRVARIAHGFNMRILVYDPYISPDIAVEHQVEVCSLVTLLKESDFVTIHTPSTSETRRMISTPELNLMKPTAYLLNASRGDVVDEAALIQALNEKKLAGAGLDVFKTEPIELDNPLLSFDNVILSAHCAGNSREALDTTSTVVAEETIRILTGQIPINLVNRSQLINHGYLRELR